MLNQHVRRAVFWEILAQHNLVDMHRNYLSYTLRGVARSIWLLILFMNWACPDMYSSISSCKLSRGIPVVLALTSVGKLITLTMQSLPLISDVIFP